MPIISPPPLAAHARTPGTADKPTGRRQPSATVGPTASVFTLSAGISQFEDLDNQLSSVGLA
ncbi:hypothetical protein N7481_008970 [Penicillium waksmanii]|uniref:uncharacterized protein n=1 Tax=Penicillium waksmanii TaxID=69791 RepID=UPI0025485757|nr:uncharacterized protein N7481_008970 [Penicillium waksmanii]KAJ5975263.1 hypothetical protein N7481_008970 [Penicillium waksmanii]